MLILMDLITIRYQIKRQRATRRKQTCLKRRSLRNFCNGEHDLLPTMRKYSFQKVTVNYSDIKCRVTKYRAEPCLGSSWEMSDSTKGRSIHLRRVRVTLYWNAAKLASPTSSLCSLPYTFRKIPVRRYISRFRIQGSAWEEAKSRYPSQPFQSFHQAFFFSIRGEIDEGRRARGLYRLHKRSRDFP